MCLLILMTKVTGVKGQNWNLTENWQWTHYTYKVTTLPSKVKLTYFDISYRSWQNLEEIWILMLLNLEDILNLKTAKIKRIQNSNGMRGLTYIHKNKNNF